MPIGCDHGASSDIRIQDWNIAYEGMSGRTGGYSLGNEVHQVCQLDAERLAAVVMYYCCCPKLQGSSGCNVCRKHGTLSNDTSGQRTQGVESLRSCRYSPRIDGDRAVNYVETASSWKNRCIDRTSESVQ